MDLVWHGSTTCDVESHHQPCRRFLLDPAGVQTDAPVASRGGFRSTDDEHASTTIGRTLAGHSSLPSADRAHSSLCSRSAAVGASPARRTRGRRPRRRRTAADDPHRRECSAAAAGDARQPRRRAAIGCGGAVRRHRPLAVDAARRISRPLQGGEPGDGLPHRRPEHRQQAHIRQRAAAHRIQRAARWKRFATASRTGR